MSQPLKWNEAKLSAKIAKNGIISFAEEAKDLRGDKISKLIKNANSERRRELNEKSRQVKD